MKSKTLFALLLALAFASLSFAQSDTPRPAGKTQKGIPSHEVVLAKVGITLPADPPQKQAPMPQQFGHAAVLTWTAPTTCTDGSPCSAQSYNIYKVSIACPSGQPPTGAQKVATVPAGTTTYTDSNIVAPGSYCWYVTAVNATGESTASNSAGGNLQQPLLAAPSNFVVSAQ